MATKFWNVKVNKATNLKAADKNGLSDPFLVFKRDKKDIYKTEKVLKSLNPEWNEGFGFQFSLSEPGTLFIQAYDWDRIGSNDKIGNVEIDLAKYLEAAQNGWTTVELPLDVQGQLHLEFKVADRIEVELKDLKKKDTDKASAAKLYVPYLEWSTEELCEWIQEIYNTYTVSDAMLEKHEELIDKFKSEITKSKMMGKNISDLTSDNPMVKSMPFAYKSHLKKKIEKLTRQQVWPPIYAKRKLLAQLEKEQRSSIKDIRVLRELSTRANQLADLEELKETYLNFSMKKTLELYQQTEEAEDDEEGPGFKSGSHSFGDSGSSSFTQSTASHVPEAKKKDKKTEAELEEEKDIKSVLEAEAAFNKTQMASMKIKLVVTELAHTNTQKNIRKLFSPVANLLNKQTKYGLFHVAVIVGPWLIEWNDSAFVVPRRPLSKSALITADIAEGIKLDDEKQILNLVDKLAEVITKWNSSMHYAQTSKKVHEGNCQDFAEDLLRTIGYRVEQFVPADSALGMYLQKMKVSGMCEMALPITPHFRNKYLDKIPEEWKNKIQQDMIIFKNHTEIDKFVTYMNKLDTNFISTSDGALLKSFDRALWMKHFKNKDAMEYMPLPPDDNRPTGCPYNDPTITKSLILDYQAK